MQRSRGFSALTALLLTSLAAGAAEIPRKAPDFAINMLDGSTMPLAKFKGHPVIFAFILTSCSHCQAAVGILSKLQKEYGPRGLQVVASAIDQNGVQTALPLFIKNFAPSFPVGYSNGADAAAFFQPTGPLPLMPLLAFIDRGGVIRAQHQGDDEVYFGNLEASLRKEIEAMLKQTSGAKKGTASKSKLP